MACSKCLDGWIITQPLGLKVRCSCMIESPVKTETKEAKKPVYTVTGSQRELAVQRRLVPKGREYDEFDEATVRARVEMMCRSQNCMVRNFGKYVDTLNEIIVGVSTNTLSKSFIIGAPNGFGKTTFANTCIKRLYAAGRKAVPYISLFELGELRVAYEKKVLGYMTNSKKAAEEDSNLPENVEYTWSDYMKSDVLFTFLTTLENKKAEVRLLKGIMDIRGPKGLPTIVFTSMSMDPYLKDYDLKRYVWDDILAYSDDTAGCDRLIHRSCYKYYNSVVRVQSGEDY